MGLDIACLVRVCVTDDVDAVRLLLRRELAGYTIVELSQRYLRQIGFGNETEAFNAQWRAGDRSGTVEEVSEPVANQLGVFESATQCWAHIEGFREAGVDLPIVLPFSSALDYQPSLHQTLTEPGAEP